VALFSISFDFLDRRLFSSKMATACLFMRRTETLFSLFLSRFCFFSGFRRPLIPLFFSASAPFSSIRVLLMHQCVLLSGTWTFPFFFPPSVPLLCRFPPPLSPLNFLVPWSVKDYRQAMLAPSFSPFHPSLPPDSPSLRIALPFPTTRRLGDFFRPFPPSRFCSSPVLRVLRLRFFFTPNMSV